MSLSVLTLNLWHDQGPWPERLACIRAWLRLLEPDLIGFQEVLWGPGRDQVAEILDGWGYHTAHGRACPYWGEPTLSFGNAIASRWPIEAEELLQLPHNADAEVRSASSVRIAAPVGPISMTCTHLNWKFDHGFIREKQVLAVAEQVTRLAPPGGFPALLVGDFNAEPDSDEIRFLTGLATLSGRSVYFNDAWRVVGEGGPGHTWSNRNAYARQNFEPNRRIDYIFAGQPRRDGVGLLETCRVVCDQPHAGVWPSDHFGVYAELSDGREPA